MAKRLVPRKSVFISHISDETDIAQWLKARMDRSTIAAGKKWLDEVDKALKRADLQIVLCSQASVGPAVGELRSRSRVVARYSGRAGVRHKDLMFVCPAPAKPS